MRKLDLIFECYSIMPVQHIISDDAFNTAMAKAGDKPVCVDFFAEWCGPCKLIAPFFDELSDRYPDMVFLKVDVDKCPETTSNNGVTAMPTFFMFINWVNKDSVMAANKSKLEAMVVKYASGGDTLGGVRSTAGGASTSSAPEPPAEQSMWAAANERLRLMGIPSFTVEPAVLVLATIGLLLYAGRRLRY